MTISKKYVFCGPKTGGNTLVSLNMAIQHQALEIDKKIAYLQLSYFPDAHTYANISNERTIFDIKNFLDEKEFPKNLLLKIAQNCSVACFQSPKLKHWSNFSAKNIHDIIEIIDQEYDVLYIDLSLVLDDKILQYCFEESRKIIIVSFLTPPNLVAIESFFEIYKKFIPKSALIFNQCPSESASFVQKKIKNREISFLGTLPIEKKFMWEQVFESQLLAFQKKSKWSHALLKILKKMTHP